MDSRVLKIGAITQSMILIVTSWLLLLLTFVSADIARFYGGISVAELHSNSVSLALSIAMPFILIVTHKRRSRTLFLGVIVYLIWLLSIMLVRHYTIDSGIVVMPHGGSTMPRTKLEDFQANTLTIYCVGFCFGAANGQLLRQMLKTGLHPVVSNVAIMLAVSAMVIDGLSRFNRGDSHEIGIITPLVYVASFIWLYEKGSRTPLRIGK
jgi:hypothetical protein